MTRLIDADGLKKTLNEIFDTVEVVTFDDIIGVIDNAPTVDTDLSKYSDKLWKEAYERGKKERPKGKWIKLPRYEGDTQPDFKCDICGYEITYFSEDNFCARCGADMREVEE